MKKRGMFLAETVVKVIIALICLILLVYLLYSIYSKGQDDEKLDQAKASLNFLIEELNQGRTQVEIYNPEGWHLGSWPHRVTNKFLLWNTGSGVEMPNSCDSLGWNECLCICKKDSGDGCDDNGYCVESNIKLQNADMKIEKPLPVVLELNSGELQRR